jgi:cellobiose-specific phosphotransferase system component IIC
MSAIRAGMVSVVPLTIIGGLFTILAFMPVWAGEKWVAALSATLATPRHGDLRPAGRVRVFFVS